MSQISAKKGGNFLFFSLREKHISELMFPSVLSSVRTPSSFAKLMPGKLKFQAFISKF
jgi:hypothetical protein